MPFPPIAILGAGCVLLGAPASRDALWKLVREGRSALVVPAASWGLLPHADRAALAREIASDVGGCVTGFERVFDPDGFRTSPVDPTGSRSSRRSQRARRCATRGGTSRSRPYGAPSSSAT